MQDVFFFTVVLLLPAALFLGGALLLGRLPLSLLGLVDPFLGGDFGELFESFECPFLLLQLFFLLLGLLDFLQLVFIQHHVFIV